MGSEARAASPMHRRYISDASATSAMHRRGQRGENRAPRRAASPLQRRCGARSSEPICSDPIWEASN
eukprot:3517523-Pyramimonas_sp.AAC.1